MSEHWIPTIDERESLTLVALMTKDCIIGRCVPQRSHCIQQLRRCASLLEAKTKAKDTP